MRVALMVRIHAILQQRAFWNRADLHDIQQRVCFTAWLCQALTVKSCTALLNFHLC